MIRMGILPEMILFHLREWSTPPRFIFIHFGWSGKRSSPTRAHFAPASVTKMRHLKGKVNLGVEKQWFNICSGDVFCWSFLKSRNDDQWIKVCEPSISLGNLVVLLWEAWASSRLSETAELLRSGGHLEAGDETKLSSEKMSCSCRCVSSWNPIDQWE